MNLAIITGRLGGDPNVRTLQGQKGEFKAADFSVAVRNFKKDEVIWVKVQVLGWAVEDVQKYLKKGSNVLVKGELQENRYKDKEGREQKVWHIQADEVKPLWSAKGDNAAYTPKPQDDEDLPY